jgi:hypothetical protein
MIFEKSIYRTLRNECQSIYSNATNVTMNLKAWYWLILKSQKSGFVPNAAAMKPNRFKFMTIFIRWRITMARVVHVAGA